MGGCAPALAYASTPTRSCSRKSATAALSPDSIRDVFIGAKQFSGAIKLVPVDNAAAQADFRDTITTEIVPLEKFWPAEGYHQDYFAKNPNAGYCRFVIAPKVKKLEKQIGAGK